MKNKKRCFLLVLTVILIMIVSVFIGCDKNKDDELGSCSVDCSNWRDGIDVRQYTNISEDDCRENARLGCVTTFCPPGGNKEDCYRVSP